MTSKRPTTNDNIRDLINDQRLETKSDILALASKVDILSAKVDNIDKAQAVSSTKIGMLITAITLVVSAITTVIVERLTGRIQ